MLRMLQKLFRSNRGFPEQHEEVSSAPEALSPLKLLCSSPSHHPSAALRREYDVLVCHSSAQADVEEATRLVLFLEAPPCSLRCFLWHRDSCPGGSFFTEFCQALDSSHTLALLITPGFVRDEWCSYMMHQALTEGPMSNRTIPVIQNLQHSQCPQELRFYHYIDLSKNPERAFCLVYRTVQSYLQNLVEKELKSSFTSSSSSCASARQEDETS